MCRFVCVCVFRSLCIERRCHHQNWCAVNWKLFVYTFFLSNQLSLDRTNKKEREREWNGGNDQQFVDSELHTLYKIQKSFHTLEIRWCECSHIALIHACKSDWLLIRNGNGLCCIPFYIVEMCSFEFWTAARHLIWMKWSVHLLVNEIRNLFFSLLLCVIGAYCHIEILDKIVKCLIRTTTIQPAHTLRHIWATVGEFYIDAMSGCEAFICKDNWERAMANCTQTK